MDNISVTQKFLILYLNKYTHANIIEECEACFLALAIYELYKDKIIDIEEKNINVLKDLPESKKYILPVYEQLIKRKSFKTLRLLFLTKLQIPYASKLSKYMLDDLHKRGYIQKTKTKLFNIDKFSSKKEIASSIIQDIENDISSLRNTENISLLYIMSKLHVTMLVLEKHKEYDLSVFNTLSEEEKNKLDMIIKFIRKVLVLSVIVNNA